MSDDTRMTVILCWHMHQPEYRDAASGEYRFPWTLLHALKDYVDMAAHLEAEPRLRAVVNFAPVLLEQIADYAGRLERHSVHGTALGEPLLDALAFGPPVRASARAALIRQCLRANSRRVIGRFPAWERLVRMLEPLGEDDAALDYLSDRFITDLLVWYWIGWIAETTRRDNQFIQELTARGGSFTAADRRALLGLLRQQLGTLLERYRALAGRGQVELAMSPYAHPILPLLLDLQAAREALPDAPQPQAACYPGGEERARWQLQHGRKVFRTHFGHEPAGCWPSEGALSTATLGLLAEEGFRWCTPAGIASTASTRPRSTASSVTTGSPT
jgi:alpha-amylase/alpha-mannosidase (GH57 family)